MSADATMLVLSRDKLADDVHSALMSAAVALGHKAGCAFATISAASASTTLSLYVRTLDPWAVVAVDEDSAAALGSAFHVVLAPDAPIQVQGYFLVAVPEFASCLDNKAAKRLAWKRLQAARHPKNPLD